MHTQKEMKEKLDDTYQCFISFHFSFTITLSTVFLT